MKLIRCCEIWQNVCFSSRWRKPDAPLTAENSTNLQPSPPPFLPAEQISWPVKSARAFSPPAAGPKFDWHILFVTKCFSVSSCRAANRSAAVMSPARSRTPKRFQVHSDRGDVVEQAVGEVNSHLFDKKQFGLFREEMRNETVKMYVVKLNANLCLMKINQIWISRGCWHFET